MISLQNTSFGNNLSSFTIVKKTSSAEKPTSSVSVPTADSVTISAAGKQALQQTLQQINSGTKINSDSSVPVFSAESRLFSGTFASLSRFLGLEMTAGDRQSFIDSLNKKIDGESKQLTTDLNKLLNKAGLGDVTKKITFSEDDKGNITIEGNLSNDKKKKLANLLNTDTELAERIKTQKARMDVLATLKQAEQDDSNGIDLCSQELAPARRQLLKDFLNQNGVALNEISTKYNPDKNAAEIILRDAIGNETPNDNFQNLLKGFTELGGELLNYLEEPDTEKDELRPLLSMKRGVLTEATGEIPDFKEDIQKLRQAVGNLIKNYNEGLGLADDLSLVDYTIILDDQGRMSIENVKTKNGNAEDMLRAKRFLNSSIDSSSAEELGKEILEVHDDEHGDVQEFKHRIVIGSDVFGDYQIESPDADRAALEEMQTLGAEIGQELQSYFKTAFGFDSPLTLQLTLHWNATGKLSIEGTADTRILGILNELNKRLSADNSDFDKKLPSQLDSVFERLIEIKEIGDKFHSPTLKKADFSVNFS